MDWVTGQSDADCPEWLLADRAGDLDLARTLIRQHLQQLPVDAPITERIRAFREEAKIMRHRDDAASLRHAVESAAHAVRLTELTGGADDAVGRGLAALELAACLFACDRFDEGARLAARWASHEDATVSGWAWALLGEAHLGLDRHFQAAAALMNAIAEFERDGNAFRQMTARIALAAAFDRAGRTIDASTLLAEDQSYWTGDRAILRTSIAHHLVRAGAEHHMGDLPAAIATLRRVEQLLKQTTGMQVAKVRMLRQAAACYAEWGQHFEVTQYLAQAEWLVSRMSQAASPRQRPAALPALPRTVGLRTIDPDDLIETTGVHERLLDETAALAATISRRVPASTYRSKLRSRLGDTQSTDQICQILEDAALPGMLNDEGVQLLMSSLVKAQGVPGSERLEASCLVDAGLILTQSAYPAAGMAGAPTAAIAAERCLRRALRRMEWLPGMEIWQARAQLGLAQLPSHNDQQREQALDYAVAGLKGLDRQRYLMSRRRHRNTWLTSELHAGYELAIELALQCGREALAADLIIFSRAAGVVVAQTPSRGRAESDEVQLLPLPRFGYIDGTQSRLGHDGFCHFI